MRIGKRGFVTAEWILWLSAALLSVMAFIFGQANIGFVILITFAMLSEMLVCMWLAILYDERTFGVKDMVRFWVEKALLLVLPLVGSMVDWAWYVWNPPMDSDLGYVLGFATTRVVLIGVLIYQLKRVVGGIAILYRDVPVVKRLMHVLDKLEHGGDPPPPEQRRRSYDPPIINDPIQEEESEK